MSDKILEEIDKLKIMYLMEQAIPHKSEIDKFKEWVDEMMCMHPKCDFKHLPFTHCNLCNPNKYAEYKTLVCLVEQLYYEAHCDEKKYHENKPEIRKIIQEVMAMSEYIKDKTHK